MISSRVQLALLHSCCYSWWSSLILTSPKHCDLLLKFASTFSSNLSEVLLVVPGLKFYAWPLQTNAFNYLWGWIFPNSLLWPLTVSKPSYSQWPLYDFQTSTICVNITLACSSSGMRYNLSCFQTQFRCAYQEMPSRRFSLNNASLFSSSWPASSIPAGKGFTLSLNLA